MGPPSASLDIDSKPEIPQPPRLKATAWHTTRGCRALSAPALAAPNPWTPALELHLYFRAKAPARPPEQRRDPTPGDPRSRRSGPAGRWPGATGKSRRATTDRSALS